MVTLASYDLCFVQSLINLARGTKVDLTFVSFFQGFEDNIRKNRTVISNWIKYAQWEESLKEIQRYF